MEKDNNQAIPLGGSTADGSSVVPTTGGDVSVAVMPPPEAPRKKNHAVVFVILGLFALLVAAAVAAGVLFMFATTDTMPKAPEITTDMSTVVKDSALEMIKDKKISFNSDEINLFLETLVNNSSEKLAENGIQVNDLFAVVANDKVTLYCRMNYKGITWPIKAVADLSYDDPYIVIGIKSANIGKLDLPTDMVIDFFGKYYVSDNITMHNGFIYYDTTDFNDQLSDVALSALGLTVEEKQDDAGDEDQGFSIKKWWNNLVGKVKSSVKNWAAKVVDDFIHDIEFQDVKVIDNEVVINVTFQQDEETDVASPSDTTEEGDASEADAAE